MNNQGNSFGDDDAEPPAAGAATHSALEGKRADTAEEMLEAASGKLRMALEVGRLGSWEKDMATGEVTGTPAFMACLGFPPNAALTYDRLQQVFHPADVERINQAISFALRTKTDFQVEHRILRADGSTGRMLVRGGAIYVDETPVRLIGVTQDVTERERIREEISLAQSRQAFLLQLNDKIGSLNNRYEIMEVATRSLAQFLKVDTVNYGEVFEERGVIIVEREWSRGLLSNEGAVRKIAHTPAWVMEALRQGQPIVATDLTTDPRYAEPAVQTYYGNANIRSGLSVPLLKEGQLKALLSVFSGAPRQWINEDIALVEHVADQIWLTLGKIQAETSLCATNKRFSIIAGSLPALVWITDPDLKLLYANNIWNKLSGLPPERSLDVSWKDWIEPSDLERMIREMAAAAGTQSVYTSRIRYRAHDGTYRWHLLQATPLHDGDEAFTGWAGISVDIQDLKEVKKSS